MTNSNLWSDGNALAGPLHDVFCVEVTTAIGAARTVAAPGRWLRCGCSTTPPAWLPAVRSATRSCCGWYTTAAAPGWTCAA
jgi:hypothetical protein